MSTLTTNCSAMTGGGHTSPHLLRYAVFHCYTVFVLGIICNIVALWCIVTCNKSRRPVKVILCSLFLTILVMCVVVMPFGAEFVLSDLLCHPTRVSEAGRAGVSLFYTVCVEMELLYIASIAIIRVVAVWSPQRHAIGLQVAVGLVLAVCLYSVITTLGILGPLWLDYVTDVWKEDVVVILWSFLHTILPVLLTLASYCFMIVAVRRNKRRLSTSQHNSVVDQATRAMLAVFISNLLLVFPHSVFHLFRRQTFTTYLIVHIFFFAHFVVDPLVFVWFNRDYRKRVGVLLQTTFRKFLCWGTSEETSTATSATSSTLTPHLTPSNVAKNNTHV